MKKILFFAAVAALSAMVSCQKEETPSQKEAKPIVFSASIAAPSDTKVSVNTDDGKVSWVAGDEITITYTDGTEDPGVYTAGSDGTTTNFTWKSGTQFTKSGNYSATYGTMPAAGVDQTYSDTPGKLIYMTAEADVQSGSSVTTVNFTFTAQCGLLKLNLYNADYSVSRISVTSTDGDTYTLTCSEAQSISTAKDFYIALPEGEYNKYVIYPSSGSYAAVKTAKTGKETSIAANQINKVTFSSLTFATPIYPESNTVGIKINGLYWAPVNCGYDVTNYKYGKLYQWGRLYGCGYVASSVYDDAGGEIQEGQDGKVSLDDENGSKFYRLSNVSENGDWCSTTYYNLWDATLSNTLQGLKTDHISEKTKRDPCPDGWRIPTYSELNALIDNQGTTGISSGYDSGTKGWYLDGKGTGLSTRSNAVFLPLAGFRNYDMTACYRGSMGIYWCSAARDASHASTLSMGKSKAYISTSDFRACGGSIRCVKDNIGINSMDEDGTSYID